MDLNIRIAGEAGQGVQSAGGMLMEALSGIGLYVLSTQSYMSRIRGGLNWFDIRLGDHALHGPRAKADLLVALTEPALTILREQVTPDAIILHDAEQAANAAALPLTATAKQAGNAQMASTVAAAAVFEILDYDPAQLHQYLRRQFAHKGEQVVAQNLAAAQSGAHLAAGLRGRLRGPRPNSAPTFLLSGGEAIALSAATAGVKLVTSYPMTPGTATFTALAQYSHEYGLVVEQAEDEIAAVNMICGAVYAGVPALTTTSGGGFALMVEGLSLAGMMELPIVIVLAQRPGPATGLPTRTAQGELRFCQYAGHGEFPRAIFAPGSVQQCLTVTRRALELAHKYQTPAIILTDQFLQDLTCNIAEPSRQVQAIDRGIVPAGGDYQRYALTDSGVSPRAIPGGDAFVVADSDEHTAAGHITEDLDIHLEQHHKRMKKARGLAADAIEPEYYGPPDARTLLIAWGSSYGPCREAVDRVNTQRGSVALLHFAQVWPIALEAARHKLGWRDRVIVVEGNSTAQFAELLREARLIGEVEHLLRYDGLPLTAECILRYLNE